MFNYLSMNGRVYISYDGLEEGGETLTGERKKIPLKVSGRSRAAFQKLTFVIVC